MTIRKITRRTMIAKLSVAHARSHLLSMDVRDLRHLYVSWLIGR